MYPVNKDNDGHDAHLPLVQAMKKYPKIVAYCLSLTSAVLLWGYDLAVVGSLVSLPAFQRDFGALHNDKWIIPAPWISAWTAIGEVGSAFGSVVGGSVQDRVGRKFSLTLGSLGCAVSGLIIFLANRVQDMEGRRGAFLTGKLLLGMATGVVKIQLITYTSENTPTCLRGP